jgi:hypothetical protein
VKDDSIVNVSVPVDLCTTVSRSKAKAKKAKAKEKRWRKKLCVVRHGEIDAVICRYWILLIFVTDVRHVFTL